MKDSEKVYPCDAGLKKVLNKVFKGPFPHPRLGYSFLSHIFTPFPSPLNHARHPAAFPSPTHILHYWSRGRGGGTGVGADSY